MAESWIKTFGQTHILKLKCCKQHNSMYSTIDICYLNLFGTVQFSCVAIYVPLTCLIMPTMIGRYIDRYIDRGSYIGR